MNAVSPLLRALRFQSKEQPLRPAGGSPRREGSLSSGFTPTQPGGVSAFPAHAQGKTTPRRIPEPVRDSPSPGYCSLTLSELFVAGRRVLPARRAPAIRCACVARAAGRRSLACRQEVPCEFPSMVPGRCAGAARVLAWRPLERNRPLWPVCQASPSGRSEILSLVPEGEKQTARASGSCAFPCHHTSVRGAAAA
ncbi:MAG TPA: hypothetical protein VFV38_19370 [Ktedonobacteraceae bacterium]|nr:hypothetical protein [Ktedonobacteraceae bacterium]